MIKYYFSLQLVILSRKLKAFGLAPFLGLILIPIFFVLISSILFMKLAFCEYIYPAIAIGLVMQNDQKAKDQFIKFNCTKKDYRLIRLFEHLCIAIPFVTFLLFKQYYLSAGLLATITIFLSQVKISLSNQRYLPTPFSKTPFEFTIGFRRTFLLQIALYFILFMAVQVDNFNLGLFTLACAYFISLSYYALIEPGYYVSIFKDTPRSFLIRKLKTGILHVSLLAMPIVFILILFYSQHYFPICFVMLIGTILLAITILTKYSSFPDSMSVGDSILLVFSIVFPPLLLFTLPKLYKKSIQKLKPLLP